MGLNADAAAKLLEPALTREPGDALATVTMAQIEAARHDSAAAVKRLMALGAVDDWFVVYNAGTTLLRAVVFDGNTDSAPQVVRRATALLADVRRSHADLPNVLAWLTRAELLGDAPPSSAAARRLRGHARSRRDAWTTR